MTTPKEKPITSRKVIRAFVHCLQPCERLLLRSAVIPYLTNKNGCLAQPLFHFQK